MPSIPAAIGLRRTSGRADATVATHNSDERSLTTMITIIPAIDLKDGRCVRLKQGRAEDVTVYSADPVEMARHWVSEGGTFLHVVDLDGAFGGRPAHTSIVKSIASAVDVPIEVGGGLRTASDIEELLDAGVARAILGTRACENPDDLAGLVAQFGDRIAVGIDARKGDVQVRGWTRGASVSPVDLAARVDSAGVKTLIYTDTSVDGMLTGPNVEATGEICDAVSCDVIASGGVADATDIRALSALGRPNLAGAIVGKALYEKQVSVKALIDAAQGGPVPE